MVEAYPNHRGLKFMIKQIITEVKHLSRWANKNIKVVFKKTSSWLCFSPLRIMYNTIYILAMCIEQNMLDHIHLIQLNIWGVHNAKSPSEGRKTKYML